ncbi:Uncharacterised protein [Mycobacteroides abscessus subsp. massiliense]|nr:Uncharacterised protein [Mycobacteroides abscessus subsp. massiliense]
MVDQPSCVGVVRLKLHAPHQLSGERTFKRAIAFVGPDPSFEQARLYGAQPITKLAFYRASQVALNGGFDVARQQTPPAGDRSDVCTGNTFMGLTEQAVGRLMCIRDRGLPASRPPPFALECFGFGM